MSGGSVCIFNENDNHSLMERELSMKMLEKGAKVLLGAMVAAIVPSAFAESASTEGADEYMETVTVIGTKTERKISEVAGSVSLLDEEYIERQLIQDIADLVKYEPGVSVAGMGDRFGLSGFSIRGIGGNRVLLQKGELRAVGKPEEVLTENLLSTLYGTDIVVENNKTVGRLVIHS